MALTKYANVKADRVASGGGSVRVTIADNVGQGNDGTSLSCRKCYIIGDSSNAGNMRVTIGTDCTATTGISVPEFGTHHFVLELDVDDVSKLYFYDSDADDDIVDILYLK